MTKINQKQKGVNDMKSKLKMVTLENRAWRGLRVYTPEFYFEGKRLVLEITSGRSNEILIQEFWHEPKHGYTTEYKNGILVKSPYTYNACYGGYIDKTFKTFKEALDYIKNHYSILCAYPENYKELISDWTWEQNIKYAESGRDNHEQFKKIIDAKKTFCVEIEILRFIRDNPNSKTQFLQKKFEGGAKEDLKFSLLGRLSHEYNLSKKPNIKQINDAWVITDQGLDTLNYYEESIKKNGFCDSSPY